MLLILNTIILMLGDNMISAEFGIINQINLKKDYSTYEPEKYDCIGIDDDIYINDWWNRLTYMKTYFHCISRPETALARWGVTLIPPESSLAEFQDIVLSDRRIYSDDNLVALANKIHIAIMEINI